MTCIVRHSRHLVLRRVVVCIVRHSRHLVLKRYVISIVRHSRHLVLRRCEICIVLNGWWYHDLWIHEVPTTPYGGRRALRLVKNDGDRDNDRRRNDSLRRWSEQRVLRKSYQIVASIRINIHGTQLFAYTDTSQPLAVDNHYNIYEGGGRLSTEHSIRRVHNMSKESSTRTVSLQRI